MCGWTGARDQYLVALLAPRLTVPDTLGPALCYDRALLVAVRDGLLAIDATSGIGWRTIPVDREGRIHSARLAAAGQILLEQRGADVVGLRPP